MRRADTAMYVAKRGGGAWRTSTRTPTAATRRDRDLLAELRWLLGTEASDEDRDQIRSTSSRS